MTGALDLKPLPPGEAVAYFRKKGLKASFAWQDVWQEEHAKAFTVAKAMRSSVLQDIRDAVDQALSRGDTFAMFKDQLQPKLQAQGWWGQQEEVDPLTGEKKTVQLGSPRRLKTIFDVNTRTAYAAGRWQKIQDTKDTIPYLRYQTAEDDRVRPEHAAWDGTVLPVDDPWWNSHYPPCDWGCRCTIIQVTEGQLKRDGGKVTDKPVAFPMRSYTNPRTGEVTRVEGGIGPGWAYNVGKAYLEGDTPSPMGPPDLGEGSAGAAADPASSRRAVSDQLLLEEPTPDEAAAAFLGGFGASPAKTVIYADKTGDGLVIGPGLFKDAGGRKKTLPMGLRQALPLVGLTLREPAEIRRAWRVGASGLSLLVRRYIGRFEVGDQPVDVVVDWSRDGWWAATSLAGALDLKALSAGPVAWPAS